LSSTEVEPEAVVAPAPVRRRKPWLLVSVAMVGALLAGGGFVAFMLGRPVPAPTVVAAMPAQYTIPGAAPVLPWPAAGQAALEVDGLGRLGGSGGSRPAPIASVAKVMTAYVVLRDHPLRPGEEGPTLTVTAEEAAAYPAQLAGGQSLIPVAAGEELTERQALQALLLPSANNIAQILARWNAGSVAAFVTDMNQSAARLGMAATRYTDPSGLDPATVSTAADQVVLAHAAMQLPALAQIVAMPQASLPGVGPVKNVNTQLGRDGIVGIKTGSTDQAGGCLLFAAEITVEGQRLRILGAVLAPGPNMADAFDAGRRLIQAVTGLLHRYQVVRAGEVVAAVHGPRNRSTALAAAADVNVLGWPGLTYRVETPTAVPGRIAAGAEVGALRLTASDTTVTGVLRATAALTPPSRWERIVYRR
jgi:D-alanyl-D-alanine carboxypeptidase (penicillin-binding protein 5/6)